MPSIFGGGDASAAASPRMGRGGPGGGPGGGGPGGGGFGGGRGGPGGERRNRGPSSASFGNRRGGGRGGLHVLCITEGNSVVDAAYSLTGQTVEKPSFAQTRFGANLGGGLNIPKIIHSPKTFLFLNYTGTRA